LVDGTIDRRDRAVTGDEAGQERAGQERAGQERAGQERAGQNGPWPDIVATYDVVAADYAALFAAELDSKPFDRALLDRFAARLTGQGPVWDVGCGPAGHITRYLADRGVEAVGVDASPGVITVARQRQPGLEFQVADMRALPAADGSLAGIVAFYSVIHLLRNQIPVALAEFRRALAPGGSLLIAMHGGSGETGSTAAFGHPVEVRVTLVSIEELAAAIEAAGLMVESRQERASYPAEFPTRRLYVWARRARGAE
jgi:SAM-dependent methyltransferase